MKKLFLILCMLCILLFSISSFAADVTLQWDASTGALGYRAYSSDGAESWKQDIGNVLEHTMTNLMPGDDYTFYVKAIFVEGMGPESNSIVYHVPVFNPGPDNPKPDLNIIRGIFEIRLK